MNSSPQNPSTHVPPPTDMFKTLLEVKGVHMPSFIEILRLAKEFLIDFSHKNFMSPTRLVTSADTNFILFLDKSNLLDQF